MFMTEMATDVFIEFGQRAVSFDVGMLLILLKAIFHVKAQREFKILLVKLKVWSLNYLIFRATML